MKITVSVDVPEGETCHGKKFPCDYLGYSVDVSYCELFRRRMSGGVRFPACIEACKKANDDAMPGLQTLLEKIL